MRPSKRALIRARTRAQSWATPGSLGLGAAAPVPTPATGTGPALIPVRSPTTPWHQTLANLSQVGVLALGIFGYFYTVVPVFQNQQLQEQNAMLELEKSGAERTLAALQEQQQIVQREIASARQRLAMERSRNVLLATATREAAEREREAEERLAIAKGDLAVELKDLNAARWEIVMVTYWQAWLVRQIGSDGAMHRRARSEGTSPVKKAEAAWTDPYEVALASVADSKVKGLEKRKIPERYYDELRDALHERRHELTCKRPDFASEEMKYQEELTDLAAKINRLTADRLDAMKQEYADKGRRIIITDDFAAETRRGIAVSEQFGLERRYRDQLREHEKACEELVHAAVKAFATSKGASL